MKKTPPEYGTPDEENPELDENFYKNAVPFYEMFPHLKPEAKKDTKSKKTDPGQLKAA